MRDCSGYFSTTSGTNDHTDGSSFRVGHDGWCHGSKRSLARFDEVHLAGDDSVIASRIWIRKIRHLIVHNDARLLRGETGSETICRRKLFDFIKTDGLNRYQGIKLNQH